MRKTNVTIRDVAEKLSMSKATVSLALNGRPGPKPETVERVLDAAREMGFTPNAAARQLGSGGGTGARTMMVGFLSDHPLGAVSPDPFHFNVMLGVQKAARAASYHVLVSMNQESPDSQLDYIRSLSNNGVDGWVLADSVSTEVVEFLHERQIPMVIAGDSAFFPDVTSVHGDSVGGAGLVTQHLIQLGHRRIGFAGWGLSRAWSSMRLAGYLSTIGKNGLPYDESLLLFADAIEDCEVWFERLLKAGQLPTAIVAGTDWLALELLKIATKNGIRVPEDLSLTGFDDAPWFAPAMNPALTSVRVPIELIGETAFTCLLAEIQQTDQPGSRIALPVELIVRASSTAPAKV